MKGADRAPLGRLSWWTRLAAVAGMVTLTASITVGTAWAPRDCGMCGKLDRIGDRLAKVNEKLSDIQAGWEQPSTDDAPAIRALLQRIVDEANAIEETAQELQTR